MSKQSGLGDNLYVAGYDLSGDIGSLGRVGGGPNLLEVTPISKSAVERIGGLRDGAFEYSSWFNPATDQSHERHSALPTADVLVTYCRGTALGKPAASIVAKQIDYSGTRGTDGSLAFSVPNQSARYGVDWGELLTAGIRTDSGAAAGSSVDFGAANAFGLQAYLHVFSFTGTDATITIESSSDDGAADAFAGFTGSAFTQVTSGPTSERIQTARDGAVERYLRVTTSTSGGFSDLQFAVAVTVNTVQTDF